MRHTTSDVNKEQGIKIIFDEAPALGDHDILAEEFINWQPLYDLYVLAGDVVVTIEIAGVDIKDFSVYVERLYMLIAGIKKSSGMLNKEYCIFHNLEIPRGRFNRRIDFPIPIEPRQCQYEIENGILIFKFPILKEKIIPIEEE